jgi:hypothetical protein
LRRRMIEDMTIRKLAPKTQAAQRIRAHLKRRPISAQEYLLRLEAQSLPKTAAELSQYTTVI